MVIGHQWTILLRSGEALASPLTRLYFPLVGVSLVRASLVLVGPAFASLLLATAPQFSLGSPPLLHAVLELWFLPEAQ